MDWSVPLPEKGKPVFKQSHKCRRPDRPGCVERAAEFRGPMCIGRRRAEMRTLLTMMRMRMYGNQVWFLDGCTALNELRASRQMGLRRLRCGRLGSERRSLLVGMGFIQMRRMPPQLLTTVSACDNVDTKVRGDILRIFLRPQTGVRTVDMDADNFTITDERMMAAEILYDQQYGYHQTN